MEKAQKNESISSSRHASTSGRKPSRAVVAPDFGLGSPSGVDPSPKPSAAAEAGDDVAAEADEEAASVTSGGAADESPAVPTKAARGTSSMAPVIPRCR